MTDQPSALARWGAFKDLADALAQGELRLAARGLWGSSRGLVIAGLARAAERPILVVAPGTPKSTTPLRTSPTSSTRSWGRGRGPAGCSSSRRHRAGLAG